jgi:hypothetical protein
MNPMPPPRPGPRPVPGKPSPAAKFFEAKAGFANHYFNKVERERLWKEYQKQGDFTKFKGEWQVRALGDVNTKQTKVEVSVKEVGDKIPCHMEILGQTYDLDPLKTEAGGETAVVAPPNSGGLLMAFFLYRQFLVYGEAGFKGGEYYHGGHEPFYLAPPKGGKQDFEKSKVMCEVLRTRHASVRGKWYFSLDNHRLIGFEVSPIREQEPCEVFLSDFKEQGGRSLPSKIQVRHRNEPYAELTSIEWGLNEK